MAAGRRNDLRGQLQPMRLQLGCRVCTSDGDARELADVVIHPDQRSMHLVVQPKDSPGLARLVPIDKARGGNAGGSIELDWTADEIDASEAVHTARYVRLGERVKEDPEWGVGIEEVTSMPCLRRFGPAGSTLAPARPISTRT